MLILHEIMKRIQSDLQLPDLPRPCDYFHLIGGTSTGGYVRPVIAMSLTSNTATKRRGYYLG